MNAPTIIVGLILLVIVGLVIWKLHKDKKSGKGGCNGSCGSCSCGCGCESFTDDEDD